MTPITLTLKDLRKKAGLTQAELAAKVGTQQATISNLEQGKSRRIEFELLDKLCKVLGAEPNDLLAREQKRKRVR